MNDINDIFGPNNKLNELQKLCGDGSNKHIYVCKSSKCKLNEQFLARYKVVSSCSKRIYERITPPGTVYVDCNSANVIYLITCNNSSLQYVGETVQKINDRFTTHRQGIKSPEKYGTCKILSDHFNKRLMQRFTIFCADFRKVGGK